MYVFRYTRIQMLNSDIKNSLLVETVQDQMMKFYGHLDTSRNKSMRTMTACKHTPSGASL